MSVKYKLNWGQIQLYLLEVHYFSAHFLLCVCSSYGRVVLRILNRTWFYFSHSNTHGWRRLKGFSCWHQEIIQYHHVRCRRNSYEMFQGQNCLSLKIMVRSKSTIASYSCALFARCRDQPTLFYLLMCYWIVNFNSLAVDIDSVATMIISLQHWVSAWESQKYS